VFLNKLTQIKDEFWQRAMMTIIPNLAQLQSIVTQHSQNSQINTIGHSEGNSSSNTNQSSNSTGSGQSNSINEADHDVQRTASST